MWIYRITNLANNKVYIGQTHRSVKERWDNRRLLSKNKHKSPIRLAVHGYRFEAVNA